MKNLILLTALLTGVTSWTLPVLSQETNSEQVTITQENIESLSTWLPINNEADLLKKSEIAKEIQQILGLQADGIVGRKTITAIRNANISADFEKLTRTQITETKLLIGVSEGKITQEEADNILTGRTQIKEIKEKESGDLTKEEAKTQIANVRETMPSKNVLKEVVGKSKKAKSKKPNGKKNNGGGKKKK